MSSQPWSDIDPETALQDADSVMLLLDGQTGVNANKRATLATLRSFIVDQTASVPIFTNVDRTPTFLAGSTFFPLSGAETTGTSDENKAFQLAPLDQTYRNFFINITTNEAGTSANTQVEFRVNGITADVISIPTDATTGFITSPNTINVTKNDLLSYRVFIETGDGGKITLGGISCTVDVPISGGLATEFTWASSDEDSSLITGILYLTEASNVTKPLSEVILSVKNTPTGSGPLTPIEVNVIQEDGPNSNSFPAANTIFSTKPQVQVGDFTSLGGSVPGTISGGTISWTVGNRLQILLTLNDSNFAATGLKVSLL